MTMQELITQLTGQSALNLCESNATLWLSLPHGSHQLRICGCLAGVDVGLYEKGSGRAMGRLIPLFELTLMLDSWQPADISWTPAFWNAEGAAVDYVWFVQHCTEQLISEEWLTQAQLIAEEEGLCTPARA